ncbi:unnamed protein product [Caenorhabditis auriculariae]|uniref:Uncharacterized protein n=1 Tax=Caenorhabditis auriculariae TaxID=2777116 RepID=A0A8S1H4B7_9PELO|nr:unnamed protein product [Caenorhabditis auriculariae]
MKDAYALQEEILKEIGEFQKTVEVEPSKKERRLLRREIERLLRKLKKIEKDMDRLREEIWEVQKNRPPEPQKKRRQAASWEQIKALRKPN